MQLVPAIWWGMAGHPAYEELSREQLIEALTVAHARIAALEAQVAELAAKRDGKPTPQNSSLPPSQGDKPNRPERRHQDRPKRSGFHRRALHPDPDQLVQCRPVVCDYCGGAELEVVTEEDYDHHELAPQPVQVTRVRLVVCTCATCGHRTKPQPPEGLEPNRLVGARLRAFLLLMRHHLDAPLRRLRAMLDEAFGLQLSEGFLVATTERAVGAMAPAVRALAAEVRTAPVILSDETGLRVDGRAAHLWLFRTADAVFFQVAPSRAKAVVEDFLGTAEPACWVSDRYGGQRGFGQERQACLAHLRRDAVGAVERGDTAFAAALEQLVLAIMTADRRKPHWTDRTLAERRRVLENRVDAVVAILPLHPDGERLRRWLKAHRDELTLCLRRRDVPATNNASERALRPVVTARKVFGGLRSWAGAHALAAIRSVIATARARGMSAMEGLTIALAGQVLPPARTLNPPA